MKRLGKTPYCVGVVGMALLAGCIEPTFRDIPQGEPAVYQVDGFHDDPDVANHPPDLGGQDALETSIEGGADVADLISDTPTDPINQHEPDLPADPALELAEAGGWHRFWPQRT